MKKEGEMLMKKGILILGIVVLTGLLLLAAGALTAADKCTDVPDEIMIENEGYKTDKKGPVKLTHKKHSEEYKVACTECHHEYKEGKNVWKEGEPVKKCAECHSPLEKKDKVLKLNISYHKNCKTCHKEVIAADPSKKAPFKKCTECHQKKPQ
ncbi:MAG: cytochrome c3 family protein [Deltaproteobacteria bacterium]|nr:MAG: cytochrome c3 family protein [Deltaproteobacteria bacterium]